MVRMDLLKKEHIMTAAIAKTVISPRQGFAMCEGKKFLLASKKALLTPHMGYNGGRCHDE